MTETATFALPTQDPNALPPLPDAPEPIAAGTTTPLDRIKEKMAA
jgi:hypothetical protein